MNAPAIPAQDSAEGALAAWLAYRRAGTPCALAVLIQAEGGGQREPGAMMAVAANGAAIGYLSGGCIDADVAAHAQASLQDGRARVLRYGQGSPFIDIRLPCGGALGVLITPRADEEAIEFVLSELSARRPVRMRLAHNGALGRAAASDEDGWNGERIVISLTPRLRVRIAGDGPDAIALARLCAALSLQTEVWSRSQTILAQALQAGVNGRTLTTPETLPNASDDPWTAFASFMHDVEWDAVLLDQALSGPAFFVGAVGSHRARDARVRALAERGRAAHQIARVRMPIGLLPGMRHANELAVSTLAEMVRDYQTIAKLPVRGTAFVLLAAGAGSRFSGGDKLLAQLAGKPVLAHAAARLAYFGFGAKLAVAPSGAAGRQTVLREHGWTVLENPSPQDGIGASIAQAMTVIDADPAIDRVLVHLGDMPLVSDAHLLALLYASQCDATAVMSACGPSFTPPAVFLREHFSQLRALSGDRGARPVFDEAARKHAVPLDPDSARDVDIIADVHAIEDTLRRRDRDENNTPRV